MFAKFDPRYRNYSELELPADRKKCSLSKACISFQFICEICLAIFLWWYPQFLLRSKFLVVSGYPIGFFEVPSVQLNSYNCSLTSSYEGKTFKKKSEAQARGKFDKYIAIVFRFLLHSSAVSLCVRYFSLEHKNKRSAILLLN